MQELIDALLVVDKANDLKNKSVYHNRFYLTNGSPEASDIRVQKVIELANEHLINIEGGCNWENIDILENLGYSIYAGEQDSFGWLSGCIETINGIIVYG